MFTSFLLNGYWRLAYRLSEIWNFMVLVTFTPCVVGLCASMLKANLVSYILYISISFSLSLYSLTATDTYTIQCILLYIHHFPLVADERIQNIPFDHFEHCIGLLNENTFSVLFFWQQIDRWFTEYEWFGLWIRMVSLSSSNTTLFDFDYGTCTATILY